MESNDHSLRKISQHTKLKQTGKFILHFVGVIAILFCGALVFAVIEDFPILCPDAHAHNTNNNNNTSVTNKSSTRERSEEKNTTKFKLSPSMMDSVFKKYNIPLSETTKTALMADINGQISAKFVEPTTINTKEDISETSTQTKHHHVDKVVQHIGHAPMGKSFHSGFFAHMSPLCPQISGINFRVKKKSPPKYLN